MNESSITSSSDCVAETERLRLRRLKADEAPRLLRVFGDPEIMRFSLGGPRDFAWCEQRVKDVLKSYEVDGFGAWRVELKDTGDMIGYCGLKRWPNVDGRPEVEIGYRYLVSSWGRGYGTEAARAVRDLGFSTFGMKRLASLIEPTNIGSWRIAEKIGMRIEKTISMNGKPVRVYVLEQD